MVYPTRYSGQATVADEWSTMVNDPNNSGFAVLLSKLETFLHIIDMTQQYVDITKFSNFFKLLT